MDIYYSKYLKYKKKYLELKSNENYYGGKKPASKKLPARCLKDNQKVSNKPFHKITKEEIAAAYVACEITKTNPTALKSKMESIKVGDTDAVKYLLKEYVGPAGQKYTPKTLEYAGYKIYYLKKVLGIKGLKDSGYTALELKDVVPEASDMLKGGYSVKDLKDGGYTILQLRGRTPIAQVETSDLLNVGYNVNDIIKLFYVKDSPNHANNQNLLRAGISPVIDQNTPMEALKKMDKNYPESFVVPNFVTKIGANAFMRDETQGQWQKNPEGVRSKRGLKSVVIPGSVKEIGDRAFYGCILSSITISEGVKIIGKEAFRKQDQTYIPFSKEESIKHLVIPKSIEVIGVGAFRDTHIDKITFPRNRKLKVEEGAFKDTYAKEVIKPSDVDFDGRKVFGEPSIIGWPEKVNGFNCNKGESSNCY